MNKPTKTNPLADAKDLFEAFPLKADRDRYIAEQAAAARKAEAEKPKRHWSDHSSDPVPETPKERPKAEPTKLLVASSSDGPRPEWTVVGEVTDFSPPVVKRQSVPPLGPQLAEACAGVVQSIEKTKKSITINVKLTDDFHAKLAEVQAEVHKALSSGGGLISRALARALEGKPVTLGYDRASGPDQSASRLYRPGQPKSERLSFLEDVDYSSLEQRIIARDLMLYGNSYQTPTGRRIPPDEVLLERKHFSVEEVSRFFAVPPELLGRDPVATVHDEAIYAVDQPPVGKTAIQTATAQLDARQKRTLHPDYDVDEYQEAKWWLQRRLRNEQMLLRVNGQIMMLRDMVWEDPPTYWPGKPTVTLTLVNVVCSGQPEPGPIKECVIKMDPLAVRKTFQMP